MNAVYQSRYLRKLLGYAWSYKALLFTSVAIGVLAFSLQFVFPWLIGSAIDDVILPPKNGLPIPTVDARLHWLMILAVAGVITALLHAGVAYARGHLGVMLGNRIVTQLRCDLFQHLQRLSLQFYAKQRTGSITSRLLHDVHVATGMINGGMITVGLDVIQLIIALALLFATSWQLTLAILFILPAYALTFRLFNPKVREASKRLHEHYCKISGTVQEQLAGIALTKAYAAEDREERRFSDDVEEHHTWVVEQSHVGHMVGAVSEILVHTGTVIVFAFGAYLAVKGKMTAGDMTRFLGYLGIMYSPLRRFAELNMVYQNSLAAVARVFCVFDITPTIQQKPRAVTKLPGRGEVVYQNVRFHYEGDTDESRIDIEIGRRTDAVVTNESATSGTKYMPTVEPRWVLEDVSFKIAPGEKIALVGPSGSGKSTLASLLPRLYDVNEGAIRIDGIDVKDYSLKTLRQSIGVVAQDAFIFSGSVRENLIYGKPEATQRELVAAAQAANAHDFILRLPKGYETELGERGVMLSGGQRQRLSIARALLKDPRILVLDEATSALDTESEKLVQEALDRLMRGRTSLIIAHRLSTVRNADRILVLRDGRIVESGSHDQLIEHGGLYARLVRQQFGTMPAEPSPIAGEEATFDSEQRLQPA